MSDTSMVHTEHALVKVIEGHESVRLKICPRRTEETSTQDHIRNFAPGTGEPIRPEPKSVVPEYVEVQESSDGPFPLETELNWGECNLLIHALRRHRDRVFGTPA
jgi:hypothetical protein